MEHAIPLVLYGIAAGEVFLMMKSAARADAILRWGRRPRIPTRRITRALQRFCNWLDSFQPKHKES